MTIHPKRTAVSSDNLVYDLDKSLPGISIPTEDFWVFGYGSLIWNPGFEYIRAVPTRIYNFQREFCLQSTRYRGTEAYYGLVLALAKSINCATQAPETQASETQTHCDGVGFLVSKEQAANTCAYLYEREMQHYSYIPTWIPADFSLGETNAKTDEEGQVLAFVIDPTKPTYHGNLSFEETVERISKAVGPRGSNRDYLYETVEALKQQNLTDEDLNNLLNQVDAKIALQNKHVENI